MQAVKNCITNVEVIKSSIAQQMDSAAFASWIEPLVFQIKDSVLFVCAQNQFSVDYVKSVYGSMLQNVADAYALTLKLSVAGIVNKSKIANDNIVQSFAPAVNTVSDTCKNIAFDSFIASEENAFVLSACKKVASSVVRFSPLYIYGAAGCGKSLLAECIKSENQSTIMMTGGQFVAEFTRALHNRTIFAFKDYCRNCDVFILDDVQTLGGKTATMDEFLQLVTDLRAAGKTVVLTANCAPNNLSGFDRRAQAVLASGLVADVVAPNTEVKLKMLKHAGITDSVANAIVNRIANNGHMISGIINKMKTYMELMGTNLTVGVAEKLLGDVLEQFKTPIVMVKSMCEKLGVSYDAVCGTGREHALVFARQIMMVVLKKATRLSLAEIGRYVGDRNHASVMYAIQQIEKQQQTDLVLSAQINKFVADCQ